MLLMIIFIKTFIIKDDDIIEGVDIVEDIIEGDVVA